MLKLKPEKVNFKIATTFLQATYSEEAKVIINVEALLLENYLNNEKYVEVSFEFNTVAELRCKTINFSETHHNAFELIPIKEKTMTEIEFWKKNQYCINSGFYQVIDSEWLKEMKPIYDPLQRLNLKHYLIEGYDSYVEVLAKDYQIKISL